MSESLRRLLKVERGGGGETTMDSFDGAVPVMPPYDDVLYSGGPSEQTSKQSPASSGASCRVHNYIIAVSLARATVSELSKKPKQMEPGWQQKACKSRIIR